MKLDIDDNDFWKIEKVSPEDSKRKKVQYYQVVYKRPYFSTALIAIALHKLLRIDSRFQDIHMRYSNIQTGFLDPFNYYTYEREILWRSYVKMTCKELNLTPQKVTLGKPWLKQVPCKFYSYAEKVSFAYENDWENSSDDLFVKLDGEFCYINNSYRGKRQYFHALPMDEISLFQKERIRKRIQRRIDLLLEAFASVAKTLNVDGSRESFNQYLERWRHSLWAPDGALCRKGWEQCAAIIG